MKIASIMKRDVATARPEDTLSTVLQLMHWAKLRHLPVIEDGRVVGVISERDVLARGDEGRRQKVFDAMSTPARVGSPEDDTDHVASRMVSEKLGCLPIVDAEGRLVGLVTRTDIIAQRTEVPEAKASGTVVAQVMSRRPVVGRMDDRLLDAAARMQQHGIRHLPVVDGEGRVVAMLSDRDVRTLIGDPGAAFAREPRSDARSLRVSHAASGEPLTIDASRPLQEAIRLFATFRVGALPVVSASGEIEGILSYVDVMRSLLDRPGAEASPA